jgi:hypothetical protein
MEVRKGRKDVLLCRKAPSFGENVVVVGEKLQHPIEVSCEKVFAADFEHSGKMLGK